jgi:hypothetical protein
MDIFGHVLEYYTERLFGLELCLFGEVQSETRRPLSSIKSLLDAAQIRV